jgi:hypothetical protein
MKARDYTMAFSVDQTPQQAFAAITNLPDN